MAAFFSFISIRLPGDYKFTRYYANPKLRQSKLLFEDDGHSSIAKHFLKSTLLEDRCNKWEWVNGKLIADDGIKVDEEEDEGEVIEWLNWLEECGEIARCRAVFEEKANSKAASLNSIKPTDPLVLRLFDLPSESEILSTKELARKWLNFETPSNEEIWKFTVESPILLAWCMLKHLEHLMRLDIKLNNHVRSFCPVFRDPYMDREKFTHVHPKRIAMNKYVDDVNISMNQVIDECIKIMFDDSVK